MMQKFSEMFIFQPKSKIKAGEGLAEGAYPFFTCSPNQDKFLDVANYSGEALIFGTGGNATLHYANGEFSSSTDCLVAFPKSETYAPYVYHYLFSNMSILQKGFRGSGLKHISKSYISDIKIPLVSIDTQKKIVTTMRLSLKALRKRNEQIVVLDKIAKDTFIEMFGNLKEESFGHEIVDIESICSVIVDCPHSTPKYLQENTGFLCIKTGDIRGKEINWDSAEFLSEENYLERIRRYKPRYEDIVYSREGAIYGIAAMIDRDYDVALGQRMMLFSLNREKCDPYFFLFQMNDAYISSQADACVVGSASPHINIRSIKKFRFALPPIEKQQEFARQVKMISKLKKQLRTSLRELESAYKSTSHKAFNGELFN